jgi:hypothetical protein
MNMSTDKPEPTPFDFVCDARISVSFLADTLAEAQEQWTAFVAALGNEDNLCGEHVGQFYVSLNDVDPEVMVDGEYIEPEQTTKRPPKLADAYKANFETLETACHRGDLALVSIVRKADQKGVAAVCAMSTRPDDEYITPVPLAVMVEGNPYELFEDPTQDFPEEEDDDSHG